MADENDLGALLYFHVFFIMGQAKVLDKKLFAVKRIIDWKNLLQMLLKVHLHEIFLFRFFALIKHT